MGKITGRWLVLVVKALVCLSVSAAAQNAVPIGCYTEDAEGLDFTYHSQNTTSGTSVTGCVAECKSMHMRYAGLLNGTSCLCGNILSITGSNGCDIHCSAENGYLCGGEGAMSVYETRHGILGPPLSLTQVDSDPSTLHITWESPAKGLPKILQYDVTLKPLFSYSERDRLLTNHWTFSTHTHSATLRNLQPGTKYSVEVRAASPQGKGDAITRDMWTKVGKPEIPATPQVINNTATTMTVQLEPVIATSGPVTAYQVVVKDETVSAELQPELLDDYFLATSNNLPFYIAAQLPKDQFVNVFKVGDGKHYGRYYNAPLQRGVHYHVILGVVSTLNHTQTAYSSHGHEQHKNSMLHDSSSSGESPASIQLEQNQKVILGLSIAIGIFGFLLLASIIVYVAMRIIVNKNRRSSENQELAIHAQQPNQDLENGYSVAAHYVDEETTPADHYRQLKEKVWIIPHLGLNVVGDIGAGKFGDVRKVRHLYISFLNTHTHTYTIFLLLSFYLVS